MLIKNILPGKEGLNSFHNRIINFVSSHSSNHPSFLKDSFKLRSKAAKMFSWGLKNFWVTYCSNIVPINASEHFMISVSSKFLKIEWFLSNWIIYEVSFLGREASEASRPTERPQIQTQRRKLIIFLFLTTLLRGLEAILGFLPYLAWCMLAWVLIWC